MTLIGVHLTMHLQDLCTPINAMQLLLYITCVNGVCAQIAYYDDLPNPCCPVWAVEVGWVTIELGVATLLVGDGCCCDDGASLLSGASWLLFCTYIKIIITRSTIEGYIILCQCSKQQFRVLPTLYGSGWSQPPTTQNFFIINQAFSTITHLE